jgi:hypothetical protein
MKRSFFIYLLVISPILGLAQQKLPKYMSHDTSLYQYPPLVILKMPNAHKNLKMSELNQVNPNDIDSVTILKDTNAVKLYGKEARFGVLIIKMKKDIAIIDTGIDSYCVNNFLINNKTVKSYNLPVYIDSLYVNRPENVDMMMIKVKSATINTEPTTGIKFINILTYKGGIIIKSDDQKEKPKNDGTTIMIR